MATQLYSLTDGNWTPVSNGAALVDLATHCDTVLVTTLATGTPSLETKAFHSLSTVDARCFSYGGTHTVFVRAKKGNAKVIVTGDNLL